MTVDFILKHSLSYGFILATLLSLVVMGSLYINPEIGWRTYPPGIKAAFGPMSERARKQRIIVGLLFVGIVLGTIMLALRRREAHDSE